MRWYQIVSAVMVIAMGFAWFGGGDVSTGEFGIAVFLWFVLMVAVRDATEVGDDA